MVGVVSIPNEFVEVKAKYPRLLLSKIPNGSYEIIGELEFLAEFQSEIIEDVYAVLIKIPSGYPKSLPVTYEIGGRIPQSFHHFDNGSLCLGTPLSVKMRFHEKPNLLGFIEVCLIEYLYGYSYFQKHGELPIGEFAHGVDGIIEHYQDIFGTEKLETIIELLSILANDSYRGHIDCVCGSGNRLRNCHGKPLLKLMKYQTPWEYQGDLSGLKASLRKRYSL
jgi:hypothetical protein